MPGAPYSSAEFGSNAGGFRVQSNAERNLRIAAWGYWPTDVTSSFGVQAVAAVQALTRSSVFVFDSKDLKPQGTDGQEAIRLMFRALARLSFAKGVILRGNAMTCMQLARLLRECAADQRLEFVDTHPLGT